MKQWKQRMLVGSLFCLLPLMVGAQEATESPAAGEPEATVADEHPVAIKVVTGGVGGPVHGDGRYEEKDKVSGDEGEAGKDVADKSELAPRLKEPITGERLLKLKPFSTYSREKGIRAINELSRMAVHTYAAMYQGASDVQDWLRINERAGVLGFWDLRAYEVGAGDIILSLPRPELWMAMQEGERGAFKDYVFIGGSYTTYTHPPVVGEQSEKVGPPGTALELYHYFRNLAYSSWPGAERERVSHIQLISPYLVLYRHVHVGSPRGKVLQSYGAPNGIWRDEEKDTLYFAYITPPGYDENNEQFKKENPLTISKGYITHPMSTDISTKYLVFAIHKGLVDTIDMFDSHAWPTTAMANQRFYEYRPNRLADEDFVLMGRRIGERFHGSVNQDWKTRGETKKDGLFFNYPGALVMTNEKQEVAMVMLQNSYQGVTRRGLTLGDPKGLLLYLYGAPTRTKEHPEDGKTEYIYQMPENPGVSLRFLVGDKTDSIEEVVLASNAYPSMLVDRKKRN